MTKTHTAYIALGANLNSPASTLEAALISLDQAEDAFHLFLSHVDLLRRGAVRHRHQDVGETVLGTAILRAQGGVHLAFADHDPGLGETLAQALGHQPFAQRAAEVAERHAVRFQLHAQLVHRAAVLLGNGADGGGPATSLPDWSAF